MADPETIFKIDTCPRCSGSGKSVFIPGRISICWECGGEGTLFFIKRNTPDEQIEEARADVAGVRVEVREA